MTLKRSASEAMWSMTVNLFVSAALQIERLAITKVVSRANVFGKRGYEIAAVTYCGFNKSDGKHYYTLFFTKKKIKNFTE